MYTGGFHFSINKSFGTLQLVPETTGLRLFYVPIVNGREDPTAIGFLDLLLPLEVIGGLWATTRAFLYNVESLDENIVFRGADQGGDSDILVKLYRDKPRGQHGKLSGEELCWLRLVTGRSEEERRRIKLGSRDLLCIELACTSVLSLAVQAGTHNPRLE